MLEVLETYADLLIGFGIGAGFVTLSEMIRDVVYDRREKRTHIYGVTEGSKKHSALKKDQSKEETVDVRKEEAPKI